jgi:UDP-glucose 6-dehydrogenase
MPGCIRYRCLTGHGPEFLKGGQAVLGAEIGDRVVAAFSQEVKALFFQKLHKSHAV